MVWVGPLSTGGVAYEKFDSYPFDFGAITGAPGSYDYSEGVIITYNDFNLNRFYQVDQRMIVSYNGLRLFNGLDYTLSQENDTTYNQAKASGNWKKADDLIIDFYKDFS